MNLEEHLHWAEPDFRIDINEDYIKTKLEVIADITDDDVDETNDYFDINYYMQLEVVERYAMLLNISIDSNIIMYKDIIVSESGEIGSKLRLEADNIKMEARNQYGVGYEEQEPFREIDNEVNRVVASVQNSFIILTGKLEKDLSVLSSVLKKKVNNYLSNMNSVIKSSKITFTSDFKKVTNNFLVELDKLDKILEPNGNQNFEDKLSKIKKFVDEQVVYTCYNQKDNIFSTFYGFDIEFMDKIGDFLNFQYDEISKKFITARLRSYYDVVFMDMNNLQFTVDRILNEVRASSVYTEIENPSVMGLECDVPSSGTNNQEVTEGGISNVDQSGAMCLVMDAQ